MAGKRKNVDSIVATTVEEKTNLEQELDKPLLSIIEPETKAKTNSKKQKTKDSSTVREKSRIKFPSLRGKKQSTSSSSTSQIKSDKLTCDLPLSEQDSRLRGNDKVLNEDDKGKITKTLKAKKPPILKRHHKIIMASCAVLSTLVILTGLLGGGAYAHQAIYENKVFPGVVVWGEDVGGKSMAEVQAMITEKVKTYEITLSGPDQDYKATTEDLGVIYDSESMALAAFSRGRTSSSAENYLTRARLLATKLSVPAWQKLIRANDLTISPSYVVDEEKFNTYVSKIADNIKISARDSEVNVTAGQVQLKPAIYGREVQLDVLKEEVRNSITSFDSLEIVVETVQVKPAIIDDAAQEVMIQAQNVMQRPIVLTYKGTEYRPNQETVASWISFVKKTGDTKYTLVVDTEKMKNYFDYLGTKINIQPISRKIRVENGVKETEIRPGVDGLLIDTALLGKMIAEQLPNQATVAVTIPSHIAKYKTEYERVVIANWEKYIDINITTQTMTACERNGVNCKQWLVTTGDRNHSTPTGTFLVLGRNANFYMHDPAYTYNVHVDYATWFTSAGHAIHDASWRNGVFGDQSYLYNGSHGCINSPDSASVFVYNWAPVGTPVIIHY